MKEKKREYTIKDIYRAEGVGRTICKGHDTPSRETIQMIDELKTTIKVTCNQMENIEKKVDAGFKENSEQHKELVDMLSKNLDKKADKEVVAKLQENQTWISRLVIGLIVSGVIGFIFFK